ncbi:ATP-binding protein [Nitrincola schmidtii]|uniref:ATP-binding protein n=1 Tax=Nitrincola schmidtii TaxID=1730894 RepID=UPI00145706DE|nr:transporter substrate-binding domain-containing protein [Nitrincola schmidtii]
MTVQLCVDPDWEPYEWIDKEGNFHGIAADLINKIAGNANVNFEIVATRDWPESLEFAKARQCDALAFLNQTPERSEWLDFSEIYFTDPNVFITHQDFEYIRSLAELNDNRVALPHGTGVEQHLRRHYPKLTIQTYDSEIDAILAVQSKDADIAIRSLSVAAYLLRKEGLFDLKVAGNLEGFSNQFRIGVVKDNEALVERLNIGIFLLTPDDIRSAVNRYVYIRFYSEPDYTMLVTVIAISGILIGLISFWTIKLKRLNLQLQTNQSALKSSRDQLQKSLDEEHMTNMRQHQFMRMVAHEFRTPLSVIESSCDLLELQSSQHPMLTPTIEKQRLSARYLSDLVNRSLAEDRMVKTYWQRNAAWVSCEEIIRTAENYALLLNQGQHQIIAINKANKISGDGELLQMMMNNLVENAIKYSPNGGNITIQALEENNQVILCVADEGMGISEADQPMMFGKYQRGQHDTPGLGLGLYLVKGIAKLHNGQVNLTSEVMKGTTISVTLPILMNNNDAKDLRLEI